MILFHPLQNRAMQFSLQLLAQLEHSPKVAYREVEALAEQFYLDPLYRESVIHTLEDAGILELEKENGRLAFCCRCQSSDGSFVLPRMPMGNQESEYLQYILRLPEAELFLPEALRRQLLQDPTTWLEDIQRIDPTQPNQARYLEVETFRLILQAVQQKRLIRYQYRIKGDTRYTETQAVPWKLEYSAYDKRWWVILYEPWEKRTIKAVLGNLRQVKLGENHKIPEKVIRDAVEELCLKDTPVKIKVKNVHNTLQRCFLAFENQEFIHTAMLDRDTFLLSFRYYRFDTEEILRKLMMLGPAVTLLQPVSLKKELRERLILALQKTSLT